MLQLWGLCPQVPVGALPLDSTGFDPSENLINPTLVTSMSVCLFGCTQAYHRKSIMALQVFSCIYYGEISGKFQENALGLDDLQRVRVALSDTGN